MEYTIRITVLEDEDRIRELFLEMLRSIYQTENVQGYESGYLDKFWCGREDRIFVAASPSVEGFLSVEIYREPEEYIYLDDFSVSEPNRGRGIGTRLIRRAEAYAKELGIGCVVLHVEKRNGSALRLYERLGYTVQRDDGTRFLMKKDIETGVGSDGIGGSIVPALAVFAAALEERMGGSGSSLSGEENLREAAMRPSRK